MANTKLPQDVRDLCNKFLLKGFSVAETKKRVFALGYQTPCTMTIMRWFHKDHPEGELRGRLAGSKKKGNTYQFKASKRVAAWLNQQTDKHLAINTVIEWYLRELQLEKRRERQRERYAKGKTKGAD